MSRKRLDLVGQRFGKLLVVENMAIKKGKSRFTCVCDCGHTTCVVGVDLVSGNTTSCGCVKRSTGFTSAKTHGAAAGNKTGAYRSYLSMKQRCLQKSSNRYSEYGGRGISVCARWLESFENFLEDMGERPEGYSIERVDVNKGYTPDNCKWIPNVKQAQNTRNTVRYLVDGVEMIQADLARMLGVHPATLTYQRKANILPENVQALSV